MLENLTLLTRLRDYSIKRFQNNQQVLWLPYYDYTQNTYPVDVLDSPDVQQGSPRMTDRVIPKLAIYLKHPKELIKAIFTSIGYMFKSFVDSCFDDSHYAFIVGLYFLYGLNYLAFLNKTRIVREFHVTLATATTIQDWVQYGFDILSVILILWGLYALLIYVSTNDSWVPPFIILWERNGDQFIPHIYDVVAPSLLTQNMPSGISRQQHDLDGASFKKLSWPSRLVLFGAPIIETAELIEGNDKATETAYNYNDMAFLNSYRQAVLNANLEPNKTERKLRFAKQLARY